MKFGVFATKQFLLLHFFESIVNNNTFFFDKLSNNSMENREINIMKKAFH